MANKITSKYLNKNFRVKVYGSDGLFFYNTLMGFSGIVNLVGYDLLEKFVSRCINKGTCIEVCKLRRGLKITLYAR